MLEDCLTCSERTRDTECSALCDRKEGIDYPDLHDQCLIRSEALVIAADSLLDRPAEDHGELSLIALGADDRGHVVPDVVCSLLRNSGDLPVNILETERKHDPVGEDSLRNCSERVARPECVTDLCNRSEFPVLVGDRVKVDTPLKEESAVLRK